MARMRALPLSFRKGWRTLTGGERGERLMETPARLDTELWSSSSSCISDRAALY